MAEIKFNVNYNVKVRLTDIGREIYYHQYDELNAQWGKEVIKPHYPKEIDGWYETQLWDLCQTFGKYMRLGFDIPFETEIVLLVRD